MKRLLFILLVLCSVSSFGQDSTYYKTYGGLLHETSSDILQNSDSTYLLLGTTGSNEFNQSQFYLFEVDSLLDLNWAKHYGSGISDKAESLVRHNDGGYLMLGYTLSASQEDYDIILIKIDSSGEEEWTKIYGGEDWDFGYEIIAHPDGGYVIVGETYSFGLGQNDVYVLHIDEDGNVIWSQTYGSQANDVGRDICVANDDHLAITGQSNGFNSYGVYQASIIRIEFDGTFMSYAYYGFNNHDGRSISAYEDRIVISGSFESEDQDMQAFITEIHPSNFPGYFSPYGFGSDQKFFDAVHYNDSVYATGFDKGLGNGNGDTYLYQGNEYAIFLSGTTFGDEGFDYGRRIFIDSNEKVIVTGTTAESLVLSSDIFALKTNLSTFYINQDSIVNNDFFDETVSIDLNDEKEKLVLYPNPNQGVFQLQIPPTMWGGDLKIVNHLGQLLYQQKVSNNDPIVVDLTSGLYWVQYESKNQVWINRMHIQN